MEEIYGSPVEIKVYAYEPIDSPPFQKMKDSLHIKLL